MRTEFSDTFFSRLSLALKEANIKAVDFSKDLGKSARWIEISKQKGAIPDLETLKVICDKLGRDIHYFTGQESAEVKGLSSDIIFPSSYDTFANVLPAQEFSDYLSSNLPVKIDFYLSGSKKCMRFYKHFIFTKLFDKLVQIESPEELREISINVYYPKFYTSEDILSETAYKFDEDINNQLDEFYNEFSHEFEFFRKRLFHKYGLKFISKIKIYSNQVNVDYSLLEKMECAILVNDWAFLTYQNNYIITRQIKTSPYLSVLKSEYEERISISENSVKSQKKQIKDINTNFEKYHQREISIEDLKSYLTNDEMKETIRSLLKCILIVGMPGVGKSSVIESIQTMFFEDKEIEHSDEYINNRFFDDNKIFSKNDTRQNFKDRKPENKLLNLKIREQLVLSTVYKAIGKDALLDLGGKEIINDSVLFKLLDEKFTVVNLVFSDTEQEQNDDYYKNAYYQYLLKDNTRADDKKIVNEKDRSNLYREAKDENGNINLESKHFKAFIFNLCDKRFPQYQKRSHFTIYRTEDDTPESVAFKIIYELLRRF